MRSHRQNCDVSDITSEQIKCLAAHASTERLRSSRERRRKWLSDAFCTLVALVAILAGWAIAFHADNRADAALATAVYAGIHSHSRARDLDLELAPINQVAASAVTCPTLGAQQ